MDTIEYAAFRYDTLEVENELQRMQWKTASIYSRQTGGTKPWVRVVKFKREQPRPKGHPCGRGEEIDDPGKGCPNLLVHWLIHSTSQGL